MIDIVKEMIDLRDHMEHVGRRMKSEGISTHPEELLGASKVLQTWIDGIKKEQTK